MIELSKNENQIIASYKELIRNGDVQLYHLWIYILAAGVAVSTVCLSLLRPMKVASKVSEIEAMRYMDGRSVKSKRERKGYRNITVGRLTKVYLAGNKKKVLLRYALWRLLVCCLWW